MTNYYMMKVSREGVQLYGGRQEDNGSYTVFKDRNLKTVEEFCDIDVPDSDKENSVIGIIFSASYPESEKQTIMGKLSQHSYKHLKEYDLNSSLCVTYKNFPYALILSADGNDLYVGYYDTDKKKAIATTTINEAGKDPRVEKLAECIWKKLLEESSYLNKKADFEAVKAEAKAFLQSNKSELDGTIYLEGETHDFFIKRKDAEIDNLLDYGSSSVLSHLSNFVNKNHVKREETILLLSDGVSGNQYFHDVFNGFTPEMAEMDEKCLYDILTVMVNDLANIKVDSRIAPIPLANIREKRGENSIFFDIKFPKDASAIEVYRDDEKIRTITDSQFTDADLQTDHTYRYGFVAVYKNEYGDELRSEKTTKDISTSKLQLPTPVSLNIKQTEKEATITWKKPERGIVRIYHSPKPFELHRNDIIEDVNAFDYPVLSSLETNYIVQKNFCGERYFIPVTIVENVGIVGEQQGITSMITPKGVRIDSTDIAHIKVIWLWDDVPMVRIKWAAEDGNEKWEDIANDGQSPDFELPLAAKARNFAVSISALYKTSDGKTLESEPSIQKVALSPVKVDFLEAKSEAGWFSHKNEFSVTLQADGEPPCDLCVLLEEGAMPLNLTNFKSHCTIAHTDLADGTAKKLTFTYQRMQKKLPLYFRIIAADRSLPLKVVPETQKIK
ncbi:putative ACT domain containing transcriptional regulator [Prevotella sp. CAG:732]|nr:hypothetical protein [Prevotella sp. CAG:732]CDD18676.1 putative ACT domain containing transcriptional regulator [Prevotella sp. CAG:732]